MIASATPIWKLGIVFFGMMMSIWYASSFVACIIICPSFFPTILVIVRIPWLDSLLIIDILTFKVFGVLCEKPQINPYEWS